MPLNDILVIALVALGLWLLPSPGFAQLFKKAGLPEWKAYVPFLNTYEMMKLAKKPMYWVWVQLIPVVGWFITMAIFIEFVKLFGKFGFLQQMAAALFSFIYFPVIGYSKNTRYIGPEGVKIHKKSGAREWLDAAVFAVVAATLIRAFVFEAYQIPTSSMEKTLLINDFLFVSKTAYGPRVPNTPIAMPFVHHTIPLVNTKAYVEWIHIPYRRWFASPVKRNDVVVFNFPAGDTLTKEFDSKQPYYDLVRAMGRDQVWANYTIATRPVDKRENYIKRCVGIPGDTLEIRMGELYVNNEKAFVSPTSATYYTVKTDGSLYLTEDILTSNGIRLNQEEDNPDFIPQTGTNTSLINLTLTEADIVRKLKGVVSVEKMVVMGNEGVYPYDSSLFKWNADNYGRIWIPKKGATIDLTPQHIALYKRVIQVYENNKWEEKNGQVFINGQAATSYTFKMDYYWMMGDNRHKSQDSRFWGFVPEDHIVGKASLIWFSYGSGGEGIRWNRLFNSIK